MKPEECFDVWAPEVAPWSPWAKPVLFTHLDSVAGTLGDPGGCPALDAAPLPAADGATALVVDLAGARAVRAGAALAARGYRPVPLFNCNLGPSPVLDAGAIARALEGEAERLRRAVLPFGAPPAFLIDAERHGAGRSLAPGRFDNRWLVLPQDFPSGSLLLARGVRAALWLHEASRAPGDDLVHVLLRWQRAGVAVSALDLTGEPALRALALARPAYFRWALYRVLALAGLRRSWAGGFGAPVPEPSSGGG